MGWDGMGAGEEGTSEPAGGFKCGSGKAPPAQPSRSAPPSLAVRPLRACAALPRGRPASPSPPRAAESLQPVGRGGQAAASASPDGRTDGRTEPCPAPRVEAARRSPPGPPLPRGPRPPPSWRNAASPSPGGEHPGGGTRGGGRTRNDETTCPALSAPSPAFSAGFSAAAEAGMGWGQAATPGHLSWAGREWR